MGYTYKNLSFNESARRRSDNVHRVRYDSFSTELWGSGVLGRDTETRYALLGTNEQGRKVTFYVAKKVLDGLKPGKTYSFRLSENLSPGYYHQERGMTGLCLTRPRAGR